MCANEFYRILFKYISEVHFIVWFQNLRILEYPMKQACAILINPKGYLIFFRNLANCTLNPLWRKAVILFLRNAVLCPGKSLFHIKPPFLSCRFILVFVVLFFIDYRKYKLFPKLDGFLNCGFYFAEILKDCSNSFHRIPESFLFYR